MRVAIDVPDFHIDEMQEVLRDFVAGARSAWSMKLIQYREVMQAVTLALEAEIQKLEQLKVPPSAASDDAALTAWLQGQLNQWFGDAVRKNPDMAFVTPFGFRSGRHLLGLMGGRHE